MAEVCTLELKKRSQSGREIITHGQAWGRVAQKSNTGNGEVEAPIKTRHGSKVSVLKTRGVSWREIAGRRNGRKQRNSLSGDISRQQHIQVDSCRFFSFLDQRTREVKISAKN